MITDIDNPPGHTPFEVLFGRTSNSEVYLMSSTTTNEDNDTNINSMSDGEEVHTMQLYINYNVNRPNYVVGF